MDVSEARKIVEQHISQYMQMFGVNHWKLTVSYDLRESGDGTRRTAARVEMLVDYNSAAISIDPDCCDTEEDVLRHLRHELFHVVLSPYQLYRDVTANGKASEAASRVWVHCDEKAVINLERMYFSLTKGHADEKRKPKPKGKAK